MSNVNAVVNFLDLWQVHGDGGERSIGPIIGYFRKHHEAVDFARGKAWYGGNGAVQSAKAVEIDGKVYILDSGGAPVDVDMCQYKADEKLKEDTLASLSEDQLRVLGVK